MLVFAGLGLLCGVGSAAVLWWFASRPLTFYTASYEPLDLISPVVRLDSVSPYGYMAALIAGGAGLGGVCGMIAHRLGWELTRGEQR